VIEQEHFERAVTHGAVEPLRIDRIERHRRVFETGLPGPRREHRHGLLGEAFVVLEAALEVPVVTHLVVVPHGQLRHAGVEAPHVRVLQVVAVVAAVLGQRLGHLALGLGRQVLPDASVIKTHFGLHRGIRVDGVAEVDEEVGIGAEHARVGEHAAEGRIEAPALAHRVGREHERHVARPRRRRRAELPGHRLAELADIREVLERHAVEHPLAARQIGEVHPRREIVALER
jgi:hypothetical protein